MLLNATNLPSAHYTHKPQSLAPSSAPHCHLGLPPLPGETPTAALLGLDVCSKPSSPAPPPLASMPDPLIRAPPPPAAPEPPRGDRMAAVAVGDSGTASRLVSAVGSSRREEPPRRDGGKGPGTGSILAAGRARRKGERPVGEQGVRAPAVWLTRLSLPATAVLAS